MQEKGSTVVTLAGQEVDLSRYPHVLAIWSDGNTPRAKIPTKAEVKKWMDDEALAREKIQQMVDAVKKANINDINFIGLSTIQKMTCLPMEQLVSIRAEIWAGGQGGSFDFTSITPEEFFRQMSDQGWQVG